MNKSYFAMQGNAVMSRHFSKEAAKKAIGKRLKTFKKYPSTFYSIIKLKHPGYWKYSDTPARRYWIVIYDYFLCPRDIN